jgi:hypothetical protein
VDIYDLTSSILREFPDSKIQVDRVKGSLNSTIIYNINGESRPYSNGLSIYMPISEEEFESSKEYSLEGWKKIIDLQNQLLTFDDEFPVVEADYSRGQ